MEKVIVRRDYVVPQAEVYLDIQNEVSISMYGGNKRVTMKNNSGGDIIVTALGNATIEGNTTYTLIDGAQYRFDYDGTDIFVSVSDVDVVNSTNENSQSAEENSSSIQDLTNIFRRTMRITGDSITSLNRLGKSSETDTYARGYLDVANPLMGNAFDVLYNGGSDGERTDQILARFSELLAVDAYYTLILAGTNDIYQDIVASTITPSLQSMYEQALAQDSVVLACTIPPFETTYTGGQLENLLDVNAWIRKYALQSDNVILVDFFDYCVDSTTGQAKTDLTVDGIHPSIEMAYRMARALQLALEPYVKDLNYWGGLQSTYGNLLTNPSLQGGGTVADDWAVDGTNTPSLLDSDDLTDNKIQSALITSGNSASLFQLINPTENIQNGDVVIASVEIDCSNMTDLSKYSLNINFYNGSEFTDEYYALFIESANQDPFDVGDFEMLLVTKPIAIPDDTVRIYYTVVVDGVGTVKFKKPSVINLGQ